MDTFFSHTYARLLAAGVGVALIAALLAQTTLTIAQTGHLDMMPATISVTGEGEVFAVPDIGQFTFSVSAKAADAVTAQEESGRAINDIMSFLTQSDVAETDIKTLNYNLYPQYRFEERICPVGSYCGPGERVADGFEVNQTIQVKVRDTDAASAILTGVGERGATNVSGLNFVVDDTDALAAEARSAAITDAKQQAEKLAADLGVDLVRISGFYETAGARYYEPAPFEIRNMAFEEVESDFSGPSLPMGEDQVTAEVTITYEVK